MICYGLNMLIIATMGLGALTVERHARGHGQC